VLEPQPPHLRWLHLVENGTVQAIYYDRMIDHLSDKTSPKYMMNVIMQYSRVVRGIRGASDWMQQASAAAPYLNSYAILNTAASALQTMENAFWYQPWRTKGGAEIDWTAPNGTMIELMPSDCHTSGSYNNVSSGK